MKTHIIHLEHHDNVVSITDKLSWGQAQRVLLVYPSSEELVLKTIDLILIQRAAQELGFLIGLVSSSNDVRKLAKESNIPVFKSIKEAQRRPWIDGGKEKRVFERIPRAKLIRMGLEAKPKEQEWKSQIGIRLSFFSLGVLAVLAISFLFVPSAVIRLGLGNQIQSLSMSVYASEAVTDVSLSGSIPAHTISIDVEGSRLVKIRSETKVPDKSASGMIRFTNLLDEMVLIPVGTIVTRLDNSGIRFETTASGEVPSGIGETIDLPIRALTPGKAGNLEANSLRSLVGNLGTSLLVTNPNPTSGGTDSLTLMATDKDRSDLFAGLENELRLKAIGIAQTLLKDGDIIFLDTVKIENNMQENYVPTAGQPGDQLSLHLVLTYTMQYAEYTEMVRFATPALNAGLPKGYMPVDGSINIVVQKQPTTNTLGTTTLNLEVSQRIQKKIEPLSLSRLVQGLTIQEAISLLETKLGTDSKPVIQIKPSWWPRLPIVALRIAILK